MNQIESNLLEAWQRVGERIKTNPREALRRARRQFSHTLRRPMRAWCLAIRASDTRISSWNAIIEPLDDRIRIDDDVDELIKRGLPHRVTLTGKTIRELTKPVHIPWPGVNWQDAADRCGVSRNLLRAWVRAGSLAVAYYDHPTAGRGWKPRPIVYTPSPIDPNHAAGRAPDPLWGTMWQTHWQDLPEELTQTLARVPRTVTIRGRTQFAGWEWLCPGLPYF